MEGCKKVQGGDSEYMGFRGFAVKGLLINCSNLKGIRLFEEADECMFLENREKERKLIRIMKTNFNQGK